MSHSTAISLVRKYLERRLEPLRQAFAQHWPDRPFPLKIVDGDREEAHRILRNERYRELYSVTADFLVLDTRTGFIGVFKSYGLPTPPRAEPQDDAPEDKAIAQPIDALINDLRQLAYLYECQRYDEEKKVRPPSYVLFAVLPEEARNRLPEKLRLAEQHERLLEAVGLSRLLWTGEATEQALAHWSQAVPGTADPDKENGQPTPEGKGSQPVPEEDGQSIDPEAMLEVERFFAPLLLQTRTVTITGTKEQVNEWTRRYTERIGTVLALQKQSRATRPDATRADIQAAVEQKLRDRLAGLASSGMGLAETESQPLRLVAVERLRQFRRFREDLPEWIPFGRKMTIVYGTNGSGKTSLLDAVILGLAGVVVRPGDDEVIPETAVAHLGKTTQEYGVLVNEQEQPGGARPRHVRRPLTYRTSGKSGHEPLPVDILKTFVLSQFSLRSFLIMDGRTRYQWMATHLGLDVNQATQAVETLQRELQRELSVVLSKHSVVPQLRIDTDRLVERWENNYHQRLGRLQAVGEEVARLLKQARQALLRLGAAGHDSPTLHTLEAQLTEINSVLNKLGTALVEARTAFDQGEPLGQRIDQVSQLVDSLNIALTLLARQVPDAALETVERPPSPPSTRGEQVEADPTEFEALRLELEDLDRAASWLQNAYAALTQTQAWLQRAETVEAGLQVIRQVPDLPPALEAAPTREILDETEDILGWLQEYRRYVERLPALIHELQDQLNHVNAVRNQRRQRLQHLMASLRPNQAWVDDQTRYWKAVAELLAAFGLSLPAHDRQPNRRHAGAISPAAQIPGWESLLELARALRQLSQVSIQSLEEDWFRIMEDYFQPPQGDDWGGLYARLYAWDLLRKVQDGIKEAASNTIAEILEEGFGSVLSEIHWAMTGTNWGHLQVDLPVRREKNAYRVELQAAFDPAAPDTSRVQVTHVLNTAQQNILALAFFFTAYLYVGSRWSKTIILDDPFQNLDDINILGFVRLVDDVVAAIGAEQLVIALHQEGIKEYLVSEFARREPPEPKSTYPQSAKTAGTSKPTEDTAAAGSEQESSPPQPDFVLIEAFQTSDSESNLRVFQWQYRE